MRNSIVDWRYLLSELKDSLAVSTSLEQISHAPWHTYLTSILRLYKGTLAITCIKSYKQSNILTSVHKRWGRFEKALNVLDIRFSLIYQPGWKVLQSMNSENTRTKNCDLLQKKMQRHCKHQVQDFLGQPSNKVFRLSLITVPLFFYLSWKRKG